MNIPRIVDLYTQTLQIEESQAFLSKTGKQIWAELRKLLKGTTKTQRLALWEKTLADKVREKYMAEPNAVMPKYRTQPNGSKRVAYRRWQMLYDKAKSRFINIHSLYEKQKRKRNTNSPAEMQVAPDYSVVTIKVKNGENWDHDGILAGLSNLFTRIPEHILEPLLNQAKARAKRRSAA